MSNNPVLLIIDGSSLFFRAFYALPLLKTKRGIYTNAVYGFISMMESAIEKVDPSNVVICFDQKGRTFRHEMYEEYKGTRQKTPTELEQQWPILMEILDLMNIKTVDSPKYEADDLAGTMAQLASDQKWETYLLTGDRDYLQLIDQNTKVLLTKKGITQIETYDVARLMEEYGLTAAQMIDLKALMGDSSDNIPGVPGIGEKTGLALLKEYGSLENIYEHIDEISGKKRKENLTENKHLAFLSRKLGEIVTDISLDFTLDDLERRPYQDEPLRKLYEENEFFTLLKRLPEQEESYDEAEREPIEIYTADEIVKMIEGKEKFFFHSVMEGKIYNQILPCYMVFSAGKKMGVLKVEKVEDITTLQQIFEDDQIEKYGTDLKEEIVLLMGLGIEPKSFVYDTTIAEYIIDPTKSNYSFPQLCNLYLMKNLPSLDDILGTGKSRASLLDKEADVLSYLQNMALHYWDIYEVQKQKIDEMSAWDLFHDIEMPLVEVLASMEFEGMRIDSDILEKLGDEIQGELTEIEEEIYKLAGRVFNVNSPKQLGEVLFDEMGLTPIKKTKTGYSTSVDVLEKLQDESPIIPLILNYRQLSKLLSTYVQGLLDSINPYDEKIHSNFQQTVTATGRISSTEPNLQNIPIKTELGRFIRKAFITLEDEVYLDADYSQIELRILGHISEDETMQRAFNENEDIHRETASQVFHVAREDVTPLMRRQAKAVNFGIVYGISDYGLSQNLSIPRKEAKQYIDSYLEQFPGVASFMENIKAFGKDHGYVETLFHRRRYIPELSAKNFSVRSFGERVALNTPIQGTAADMIKKAMVEVYEKLKENDLESKLVLQVHDELLIRTKAEEEDVVEKILRDTMEGTMELDVPLLVELSKGNDWYECK